MRRVLVITFAAAGASALVLAAAGFGTGSGSRATLRLAGTHPVIVQGSSFKRAERVRLVAMADGDRAVDRVRARATGTFTATFEDLEFDPCNGGLVVRAVGAAGSTAELKIFKRGCPPKL
jgi:hypothetical protein